MEQIYFEIAKAIKENPIAMSTRTQFRGLLSDYQMDKLHMNLLLTGYDASLHLYLKNDIDINGADYVRHRRNLVENFGITEDNAYWIVNTWVEMYAVEVLGKDVSDFMITKNIVDALRNVGEEDIHDYPLPDIKEDKSINIDTTSVEDIGLNRNTYIMLERAGIITVRDLIDVVKEGPDRMLRIRNIGRKSIDEVLIAIKDISPDAYEEYENKRKKQFDVPTMGRMEFQKEVVSEPVIKKEEVDEPSFDELWLSVRSYNFLKRAGFNTVSDFIEVAKEYPTSTRLARFGSKRISEIIDAIREYNPALLEEYDKVCEERKQADESNNDADKPEDRVITLGGIGKEEIILSQRKTNCLKTLISGCDVGDCIYDDDAITVTYKGVEKQALLYRVNLLIENKSDSTLNLRAFDIQLDDIVVAQSWSITEHLHGNLKSVEKFSFTIDNVEKAGITDPYSKLISFKMGYSTKSDASNYEDYEHMTTFIKLKMK